MFQKVDTSVAQVTTRNAMFEKCYIPTSICYSDLCYLTYDIKYYYI